MSMSGLKLRSLKSECMVSTVRIGIVSTNILLLNLNMLFLDLILVMLSPMPVFINIDLTFQSLRILFSTIMRCGAQKVSIMEIVKVRVHSSTLNRNQI